MAYGQNAHSCDPLKIFSLTKISQCIILSQFENDGANTFKIWCEILLPDWLSD